MSSRLDYQMPINTNMHEAESNPERGSISHSLSPLSHRPSNGMYQTQLPALQDPRYSNTPSYDHTSAPQSTTPIYSPYYSPATYQSTAPQYPNNVPSLADSYNMNTDSSRPRIPSIHSPVASHHQANPVSPSTSSIRTAYSSATPHTARHQHRGSRDLQSPHSPMAGASSLRSPTNPGSPPMRSPGESSLGASGPTGPPMGATEHLCALSAADGAQITPEIIGRVEKGFFLSDSDWTCYRRNYFTVVCSFSLTPHVHALPVLLRRNDQSPTETVNCFAMSISAVVDNPSGKAVELVQHTPKRDKGPQLKPPKLKLAASQPSGKGFSQGQQGMGPHGGEYGAFPQQQQQQQFVGSFERIQFKSATANNGKRRAAQQYYHLIIELYADVGNPAVPNTEGGEWVKVARRVSAPMVVRGRSPGHYADGGRLQSPGGNSGSGSGNNNPQSPNSNGNPGMMGGADMGSSHSMMGSGPNGLNMSNMNGYHNTHMASNYTSPSPSSIRDPSIATPPPLSHMEPPIDPVINGDDNSAIAQDYAGYQYFHEPIYQGDDHPGHHPHGVGIYEDNYPEERKSEGPIITNCARFDEEISSYVPSAALPKDHPYYRKYRETDGSRGYYPDLPTV